MVVLKEPFLGWWSNQDISLVEHCMIEFCVQLGKSGSETLQLIHQAYGDNAMRP
jgi:hypothetical protein